MNNHTASLEITVNVHESTLSRKLVFWTSNWKHVIKYDLYVKFPRSFAHNVQINAKFCCKNFNDVCQVFRILHHYTWGGVFVDTLYIVWFHGPWVIRLVRTWFGGSETRGMKMFENHWSKLFIHRWSAVPRQVPRGAPPFRYVTAWNPVYSQQTGRWHLPSSLCWRSYCSSAQMTWRVTHMITTKLLIILTDFTHVKNTSYGQ